MRDKASAIGALLLQAFEKQIYFIFGVCQSQYLKSMRYNLMIVSADSVAVGCWFSELEIANIWLILLCQNSEGPSWVSFPQKALYFYSARNQGARNPAALTPQLLLSWTSQKYSVKSQSYKANLRVFSGETFTPNFCMFHWQLSLEGDFV